MTTPPEAPYIPTATDLADIARLTRRRDAAQRQLNRIAGTRYETDEIAKHFHLGTVGGSGRHTGRLNQRRERDMERSITNAVKSTKLEQQVNHLNAQIRHITSGTRAAERAAREAKRLLREARLAARIPRPRPRQIGPLDYIEIPDPAWVIYDLPENSPFHTRRHPDDWDDLERQAGSGEALAWAFADYAIVCAQRAGHTLTMQLVRQELERGRAQAVRFLAQETDDPPMRANFASQIRTIARILAMIESGDLALDELLFQHDFGIFSLEPSGGSR